jgi:hypothetical protein
LKAEFALSGSVRSTFNKRKSKLRQAFTGLGWRMILIAKTGFNKVSTMS